ncbi:MAG: nicotinate-nucleotide adenylyltransferase [Anaerovoracaceae bacterium]|nr:nicotinate-nucleotide adenylyltransferase [Bacillota bacterium]MDY2669966.1 nicotinate-nucleotide adenylyltransferase [Anaerovoracaceae bacterium]
MKIGIFGGSFNPIHYGHLVLAEHARDAAGLDRVILIPAYESPFKRGTGGESSIHNLNMTRLAAEGNPNLEVSSMEVDRGELSYTVDTMRKISEKCGPDDRLYFIMGADSFFSLEHWMGAEELLRSYSFVVARRPGCEAGKIEETADWLRRKYGADIIIVPVPQVEISSTDIRERFHSGRSVRYLTPDSVIDYVTSHGLYR